MSIADHFTTTEDAGLIHRVDPQAARRQLTMSLGLVAVLAVGVGMAALTTRGVEAQTAQVQAPVRMVVQAPTLMHVQQATKAYSAPRG